MREFTVVKLTKQKGIGTDAGIHNMQKKLMWVMTDTILLL